MSEIHIKESESTRSPLPRVKCKPNKSFISVPFYYAPSDDGTDENLLILLHGLGDTHIPFSRLGLQLKLPQTAVLALRAPEQVPFLYEESYQWYPSFDNLGEMIQHPNPTIALDLMSKVLDHLTRDCAWPSYRIHLFGFAQGGSVAAEFGTHWWNRQLQGAAAATDPDPSPPTSNLGSVVSISGPLLSYPTISTLNPTPLLLVYRPPPAEPSLSPKDISLFKKAYQMVTEAKIGARGPGMPSSKEEWEPIMRFWGQVLGRRQVEGMYEVMTGQTSTVQ